MWIMAYALSNKMTNRLQKLYKPDHPDVVSQINWQMFFLKNNGEVLTNMALLKKEDPEYFEFFTIEALSSFMLPEKIKNLVDFMSKNNYQDISNAIENISSLNSLEELKKINIKFERIEE